MEEEVEEEEEEEEEEEHIKMISLKLRRER